MYTNKVFLTQTDTMIGFLSQDRKRLDTIKQRLPHKYYIKAVDSLQTLSTFTRVPKLHKNRVRRANKTTFIMPNTHSYRVVKNKHHLHLMHRLKWAYTTSANLSGNEYNEKFAKEVADIIIEPLSPYSEASQIIKLGKTCLKRIR
jgi:tRNA A37 threonylcarbamoyladenosine synthetase subunit TsaC/SUA5/YrdC